MFVILHGDNLVSSRNRLVELIDQAKTQNQEIVSLNGEKITETDLHQALESQSLFGGDRLVVIERLFSRVKSKEKDNLLSTIYDLSSKNLLIIWEPKEVAKTYLNKLKDAKTEIFKTPAIIFQFLDNLRPGNAKQVLTLLQQVTKTDAVELTFYLLSRRIADLIVAKDSPNLLRNSPWMVSKLNSQAKSFTLDQLTNLHAKLLEVDESQKTGTAILPLASDLDLILASL